MHRIINLLALSLFGVKAYAPLKGVVVMSVNNPDVSTDLGSFLDDGDRAMLILGTYAADFNAIEVSISH